MINLYFSTQTSRQFIATILLLFAITEKSLFIRFALLALASAFHITSIPFFIIYVLGQRWRYGWLAVLGLAAVLRFYFANLLEIGRAHVRTPVTNAHLVCRLLLEKKKPSKNKTD